MPISDWRATAPQAVQDDLDALTNECLRFATPLLEKHGFIAPFAYTITTDGEHRLAAAFDDPALEGAENPNALMLELLRDGLRRRRKSYRAVGVVTEVQATFGSALLVELEHRDGPALFVLMPFRVSKVLKRYSYGKLGAGEGTRQIWA